MSGSGRVESLEIALAHAERAIADLSDVAAAQGRELDVLRRENQALRLRLERLEALMGSGDDDNAFVP